MAATFIHAAIVSLGRSATNTAMTRRATRTIRETPPSKTPPIVKKTARAIAETRVCSSGLSMRRNMGNSHIDVGQLQSANGRPHFDGRAIRRYHFPMPVHALLDDLFFRA